MRPKKILIKGKPADYKETAKRLGLSKAAVKRIEKLIKPIKPSTARKQPKKFSRRWWKHHLGIPISDAMWVGMVYFYEKYGAEE